MSLTTTRERLAFIEGYFESVLWSTPASREDDESYVETPLESCIPIDPELEQAIREEALSFLLGNERALDLAARDGRPWDFLGHDAHLTREGHGTGFWDRGDIRKPLRDILTAAATEDRTEWCLWIETDEDGEEVVRGERG